MKKKALTLFLLFTCVIADAKQCESLFKHGLEIFEVTILPKKATLPVFIDLKSEVLNQERFVEIYIILETMKDSGLKEISSEERQKLIQFRQDISFLRSAYETLSKGHKSPKKFDAFVKVFGKLKDLMLMNDSEKSQALSALVVQSFDFATFSKLVVEKPMAHKKSIKNYVKDKKTEIKRILNNKTTVDQIHTLRKSMRNLYRYLLIQKDLVALDETQALQFKYQLKYLKQINDELGMICDTNASLILDGQIKKNFPYKLELSLLQRIEYFISVVQVDYADNVNTMTKDSYE